MEKKLLLTDDAIKEIEGKIGYTFKDKWLLCCAFTRKSYAEENKLDYNKPVSNERLEFFGDSALNYVITMDLGQRESVALQYGLNSDLTEEGFTNFISYFTDKSMLSETIKELDIAKYLIMSKGDIENKVNESPSVMEDLFEAIIGAIWFDNNRGYEEVHKVAMNLLQYDVAEEEYYRKNAYMQLKEFIDRNKEYSVKETFDERGIRLHLLLKNDKVIYTLELHGAQTKHVSMIHSAEIFIDYLKGMDLWDLKTVKIDFESVTLDNAINRLQELSQKKILKGTICYTPGEFVRDRNEWNVQCYVEGTNLFGDGWASTKTEAKKQAALDVMQELWANRNSLEYFNN